MVSLTKNKEMRYKDMGKYYKVVFPVLDIHVEQVLLNMWLIRSYSNSKLCSLISQKKNTPRHAEIPLGIWSACKSSSTHAYRYSWSQWHLCLNQDLLWSRSAGSVRWHFCFGSLLGLKYTQLWMCTERYLGHWGTRDHSKKRISVWADKGDRKGPCHRRSGCEERMFL